MAIISELQQDIPADMESASVQITDASTEDDTTTEEDAEQDDFKPFTGHTDSINAITYSPDSKFIATGSDNHTIHIWEVKSGRQIGDTKRGHTNWVNAISYSPDGKSLASGSNDGTVRVWDTTDPGNAPGQILEHAELEGQRWLAVEFSPDGRLIAGGGSDGKLNIWNARERTLISEYSGNSGWVRSVAWEPSGKRFATGCSDCKVRVFDLTKPDVAVLLIEGHRGEVNSVMYSPDGKLLASGADDRSVRLWDAQTGKPVKSPFRGHKGWARSVAWSPDSTRIISGSDDQTVRVWDVSSGQTLFKGPLYAHNKLIWSVSYSPDGKSFASADSGRPPRVQIWDAQTGKPSLPLLSDKEHAAIKNLAEEVSTEKLRPSKPGKMRAGAAILAIAWFPDGRRFASAGEEPVVRIWSAQTGLQVGEVAGHRQTVNALSISADSTKLASASDDHTILIFDTASMRTLTEPLAGHDGAVYAVELTPDGSRVISGGKDKTVRFWDALTGKTQHVIEAHANAVRALSVTKDGKKLASGGDDNTIHVWDMRTYEQLAGPFRHGGSVRALSFSPDGSHLASGSDDFAVRIWNVATGNFAFDPIRVHTGPIGAVNWLSDSTKLLTAGAHDGTIWMWHASTGECILSSLDAADFNPSVLWRPNGIRAAAFSPDGKRFVSGFMDHTMRMWDTATGVVQMYKEADKEAEPNASPVEANQRGRVRQQHSIDESIMNMPATIGRRQPASTARDFWDGIDLDGPSRRQGKAARNQKNKKHTPEQHQNNAFKRFWQRRTVDPGSKLKGKGKERGPANNSPEEHEMTRMPRRPATQVSAAHDKLRVFAAGDDPRARFPWAQDEPESDEERGSPTGSEVDPSRPDDSGSDDGSEHGLVDTICFCLCLPCCK